MEQDPNRGKTIDQKMSDGFNLGYGSAVVLSLGVVPLTHAGLGVYALRYAPVTLVWLLLNAGMTALQEMLIYTALWLACCIWRRITADPHAHSAYQGTPWWWPPFVNTHEQKTRFELGLLMLMGMAIGPLTPPVGAFLMITSVGLAMKEGIEREVVKREDRAMRDAEISMRSRMGRFRR